MQPTIIAGDTLNYRTTVPAYTASSGWLFRLRLVPRAGGGVPISIDGIAEGDDWLVRVFAGSTAAWSAGEYGWAAWVERAGEVYTLETGQITVLPDPRQVGPGADSRSAAEQALAAVQALLLGKATTGQASYRINGRQLDSYPLADLLRLEAKYKAEVDRDRVAAGLPPAHSTGPRRILMRVR